MIRLEWVHASAAVARWREELKLLREEVRRVVQGFGAEKRAWESIAAKDLAIVNNDRAIRGFRAYALKRAAFYNGLCIQAIKHQGFFNLLDSLQPK